MTRSITALIFLLTVASCNSNNVMEQNNSTLETIHSRVSIRSYTEQPVSEELLVTLVKAGMAAPSGKDVRPWEFVILRDRAKLDSLAAALPYAKMLSGATAAIVVCGNSDTDNGGSFYWYLDCSAATQNILLAAQSLGLGAVWTAAYPYEERMKPVKETLKLPENIQPLCVIPIGYPRKEYKAKEKYDPKKIHFDQY